MPQIHAADVRVWWRYLHEAWEPRDYQGSPLLGIQTRPRLTFALILGTIGRVEGVRIQKRRTTITGCRDNDTRTYRLFVHKGHRYVQVGLSGAHGSTSRSCECCDLSIEDLQKLVTMLKQAIAEHRPWIDYDNDEGVTA